ncbi:MAG: flagellar protein FliS [Planctomycetota bacterium]|nr:flagellar protein FliS [Planctomycetota bacterium]MDA1212416.1 flagellar protein FliS [Planctomycetota bacterium]
MIIDEYQETQVLTASTQQLHLMVVEGALLYARRAVLALDAENREEAFFALNRSREFVSELLGGLRTDQNPALCANLKQLFSFVFHRLAIADLEQNPTRVNEAILILEKHRATWIELMGQIQNENASASPAFDDEFSDRHDLSQGRSWSA